MAVIEKQWTQVPLLSVGGLDGLSDSGHRRELSKGTRLRKLSWSFLPLWAQVLLRNCCNVIPRNRAECGTLPAWDARSPACPKEWHRLRASGPHSQRYAYIQGMTKLEEESR